MILEHSGGQIILTRQPDHATVSGLLARHWGNAKFGRPLHADSVILACARHDDAWHALDEKPILDPQSGQPYSFMNMPLGQILPAYHNAADLVGRDDPYAGFLVSMHYQGFFNSRFGLDPGLPVRKGDREEEAQLASYHAAMEQLRGRLRTIAGERQVVFGHAHSPTVSHAYLLLQVVDAISLFLSIDASREWPLGEGFRTVGGERVRFSMQPASAQQIRIEPWPFEPSSIELPFPIRTIPDQKFDSTESMRAAIEAAPWQTRQFTIRPVN